MYQGAIFRCALGLPRGPCSCAHAGFVLLEASAEAHQWFSSGHRAALSLNYEEAPGRLVFSMEVTLFLKAFAFENGFL